MNIQEYISSGIVEAYVLGLAEPQEVAEFERLCSEYPELLAAREAFELSLENQAVANAVMPDKSVRSRIFAELQVEADKTPKIVAMPEPEVQEDSTPVISPFKRYFAAASIVLLAGSIALNLYYYNRYSAIRNEYNTLVSAQSEVVKNNSILQTKMNEYEKTLSILNDPSIRAVKMEGANVPGSPDPSSVATVYYKPNSSEVFLIVNNLPKPADDQQYQLWAIVDGKPVDAGVFDIAGKALISMKSSAGAQAFAVTLEKKGGSPVPQGAMYVLGKI